MGREELNLMISFVALINLQKGKIHFKSPHLYGLSKIFTNLEASLTLDTTSITMRDGIILSIMSDKKKQ